MTYYETLPTDLTATRLHLIREYVKLQEHLVCAATCQIAPPATEHDIGDSLEPTTIVEGDAWTATLHGLGVMFSNPKTKAVVDVHVGFLDASTAFDAWRLVQYCESTVGASEDVRSWQMTLDELASRGIVERHDKYERHYVLK